MIKGVESSHAGGLASIGLGGGSGGHGITGSHGVTGGQSRNYEVWGGQLKSFSEN